MPYTIETTYHLLVYRHRTYHADTIADACRLAVDDDDWAGEKLDPETAGESFVSGIWRRTDAAYSGPAIAVPAQFGETIQHKAGHFEILLGLLKMLVADAVACRPSSDKWVERASWAIAHGEAIIAGARDPDVPVSLPRPSHVLAWLQEDRVRGQIAAIRETDPDFDGLSVDDVTENDLGTACLAAASATDRSHEIGVVEFKAALAVLGPTLGRVRAR